MPANSGEKVGRMEAHIENLVKSVDRIEVGIKDNREVQDKSASRLHQRIDTTNQELSDTRTGFTQALAKANQEFGTAMGVVQQGLKDTNDDVEEIQENRKLWISRLWKLSVAVILLILGVAFGT